MSEIRFRLNGQEQNVTLVDPHLTVLNWLRQQGLTGSKEGCAEGECGACAVLLLRPDGAGSRLESVNGCLLLLGAMADQELWTVEGLAQQGLHPVQAAMLNGGSQCGYCTPGFVVSMAAEYYRKDRQHFDLEALSGNLCRCTGYRPIKDAADGLGQPDPADPLVQRLQAPIPGPQALHASGNGEFYRPVSLAGLFELMDQHPKAKLVAGGTDWVVEVNQRFVRSPVQIAIDQIPELRGLSSTPQYLELGAGLSLSELQRHLGTQVPLLHHWFDLFSSRLIRNRATLGGNIGTASPIGDSPPVLLALGAELVLVSAAGERTVALEHFFTGYRQTVLQAGEIIKAVRIPLPLAPLAQFYKVAKRRMDDISTVAAGFALGLRGGGVEHIQIGLGGVAATPVRAYQTEQFLRGKPWNAATAKAAAQVIQSEFKPISDHRGSAEYRTAMLGSLLQKFYSETAEVYA